MHWREGALKGFTGDGDHYWGALKGFLGDGAVRRFIEGVHWGEDALKGFTEGGIEEGVHWLRGVCGVQGQTAAAPQLRGGFAPTPGEPPGSLCTAEGGLSVFHPPRFLSFPAPEAGCPFLVCPTHPSSPPAASPFLSSLNNQILRSTLRCGSQPERVSLNSTSSQLNKSGADATR